MGKIHKKLSIVIKLLLLVLFCFKTDSLAFSEEPNWYLKLKQIKMLETTKTEVEKIFSSYKVRYINKFNREQVYYYKSKGSEIIVTYSRGKCPEIPTEKLFAGYDVDRDIVINIVYYPLKDIKISKLKLDLRNFESYKEIDTNNYVYFNEDLGVEYGILLGKVTRIEISPSNLMKHLLCKTLEDKN